MNDKQFLCVKTYEVKNSEKIETDNQMNGKLVEGFMIETYNKGNKISTFIPDNSIVYKVKKEGFSFPEAIDILLELGISVRRKCWNTDNYLMITMVMSKPYISLFYGKDVPVESVEYEPSNEDMTTKDWEIYYNE